jgi:hypothetical protein
MTVESKDRTLKDQVADLPRTFVAPRELAGSMPRDVALDGAGKALYTVAIALFAAALVVGLLLNREARRQADVRRTFAAEGTTTAGEVTRLWHRSDDSWVAYRFEANAGAYEGQAKIGKQAWRALSVGAPIDVTYLRTDPNQHTLAGRERGVMPGWVPFVVGLALAMGGVLIMVAISRQRRLLANGRPAPAIVTRVRKHHSSHGGSHRAVYYAFPLLSGSMSTGKSDWARKAADVGAVLCIVYNPDRPRHNQPYPVPFVRVRR